MIAFKSKENHCVGKLQYVLPNILAISSRSENDINAFQTTRKHEALNKLLMPEDLHRPGVSQRALYIVHNGTKTWHLLPL